ncbi:nucleotidyltransferase family protein [Shimia thalassica]|uniref:nucleotidyltransferase family protein n=1 Tax=Shimia thalassica TaxID=1715693 RepID=UPI0026E435C2|nr:nucleotidyltransferase family protein [Shimia thalassica]MDO6799343.1 nucleotidyltransferase family protein [Shimia thalassica]
MLNILILAAGKSSRMRGRDKLAEVVEGAPLLRTMAQRALGTGYPVCVVLAPHDTTRHKMISDLPIATIIAKDAARGMAHSLAAGVAALPETCTAAMVVLADMPELTAPDLAYLATEWARLPDESILQATSEDGRPGHPVIFPNTVFDDLAELTGDQGAKSVIAASRDVLHRIPLSGQHAVLDLDTPEAWDSWHRAQSNAK